MNTAGGYVAELELLLPFAFWIWFPCVLVLLLFAVMGSQPPTRTALIVLVGIQTDRFVGTFAAESYGGLRSLQFWR